jgi:WD40 repeat protein
MIKIPWAFLMIILAILTTGCNSTITPITMETRASTQSDISTTILRSTPTLIQHHTPTVTQTVEPSRPTPTITPTKSAHITTLSGFEGQVDDVAISQDGLTLAAISGWDGQLKIWDITELTVLATIEGVTGWPTRLTMSADGNLLATSNWWENKVIIWEACTGKQVSRITVESPRGIAFSPTGDILAIGGNSAIWFWDIRASVFLPSWIGPRSNCLSYLSFSDDGKTVTSIGCYNFVVQIWDVETKTLIHEFEPPHYSDLSTMAYSPMSETLAIPNDNDEIELWNVRNGELVQTISGFVDPGFEMIFDPSGRFLCTSGEDYSEFTKVWDIVTGQVLYRLKTSYHSRLAYSMNGQKLVTGNLDGSIQVWDVIALQAPSP